MSSLIQHLLAPSFIWNEQVNTYGVHTSKKKRHFTKKVWFYLYERVLWPWWWVRPRWWARDEHNDDRSSIPHPYSPAVYLLSYEQNNPGWQLGSPKMWLLRVVVAGSPPPLLATLTPPPSNDPSVAPFKGVLLKKMVVNSRGHMDGDCGAMVFSNYLLIITMLILFNSSSRSLTHPQGHNTLLWE